MAATKTGVDLLKLAVEAVKSPELDRNAVHARLLEIMDYLLEAKLALSDAQDEQRKLQAEYSTYKAEQEKRKSAIPAQNAYWFRKENGTLDGPFCTYCWDELGKQVRMTFLDEWQHVELGLMKRYQCFTHERVIVRIPAAAFSEITIS